MGMFRFLSSFNFFLYDLKKNISILISNEPLHANICFLYVAFQDIFVKSRGKFCRMLSYTDVDHQIHDLLSKSQAY